jgi:hypothetical protein
MSIKTFGFLDESGNLSINHPDAYFAVGAIFHPWPDELIINLHRIFENFCSAMKKDPTRLEFKFNEVTKGTLDHYLNAIGLLESDNDWRFCSLVIDKSDSKFITPSDKLQQWECYLRYVKLLLNHNIQAHEQMTLLADFLRRPNGDVHSFATLPKIVKGLDDVLQVESQGILLVQMADVILGSTMYTGVDTVKIKLKKRVDELIFKIGKKRFNEWKMIWK